MYSIISPATLKRKSTFEFYRNYEDPYFNITANVEVTNLLKFCKKENHSFFLLSLHTALAAANAIPEFRFRLVGEELRCYDLIHPGSTILKPDNTFTFCNFNFAMDWKLFEEKGEEKIAESIQGDIFDPEPERLDLIYCTSIPWISFTQMKHARSGAYGNGIPKMTLGKYFQNDNRWLMPFSVEVHHALMDGIHLGQFFSTYQELMAEF